MEVTFADMLSIISMIISVILFFYGWKFRTEFNKNKESVKKELESYKSNIRRREKENERALILDRQKFQEIKEQKCKIMGFVIQMETNPKIHKTDNFCDMSFIIESYSTQSTITFFDEKIELAWQDFLNKSNSFLMYVSTNTYPCRDLKFVNYNEIPPEWDHRRFDKVRFEIIGLASSVIKSFNEFYDLAKRVLIVD